MNHKQLIDELNEIIASRKDELLQNYPRVRGAFRKEYGWPEFDPLRHEICLCLNFGFHQAAITLTNHLLEHYLKTSLGYKYSIDNPVKVKQSKVASLVETFKPGSLMYNDKDLGDMINRACTVGMITKEQKKQLHKFRESFRNAYNHADKKKIHGDKEIPLHGAHVSDEGKFEIEPESIQRIQDLPFLQGIAQYYHAKANAIPYFLYIDQLIRESLSKLLKNEPDGAG